MLRSVLPLLLSTVLVSANAASGDVPFVLPEEAADHLPVPHLKACEKPVYPLQLLIDEEQGPVVIGVKVDETGKVIDSAILVSSGFAALDEAARRAYLRCAQSPGTFNGKPTTMWGFVHHFWTINNDDKTRRRLARETLAGNATARYQLGAMLKMNATYEEMWRDGMTMIIEAAEMGQPMAQVMLAMEYESGVNVDRDDKVALKWYRKAAAQGNTIAIDQLRFIGTEAGMAR
jgi:TonB family protein